MDDQGKSSRFARGLSAMAAVGRGARARLRQMPRGARAVFLFLGGATGAEVDDIPQAEGTSLRVDGAILGLSLMINSSIWLAALHFAGVSVGAAVPMALVFAGLIGLLDRQILSSLITVEGEALLRQRGLSGIFRTDAKRRRVLTFGRIALSLSTMAAISILVRVALFAPDIDAELNRTNTRANAALSLFAERIVDQQLADARTNLAAALRDREAYRASVRDTTHAVDTSAIDAQIAGVRDSMAKLPAERLAIIAQYWEAKRSLAAEKAGARDRQGDTGRPGEGGAYHYAQDRVAQARARFDGIGSSESSLKNQLSELDRQRAELIVRAGQQQAQQRTGIAPLVSAAEQRATAADRAVSSLIQNRPALVRTAVEKDPRYIPARAGLMARVEALEAISWASFAAIQLSISFALLLSILEMAVIWSRALLGVPNLVGAARVFRNKVALDQMHHDYDKVRRALDRDADGENAMPSQQREWSTATRATSGDDSTTIFFTKVSGK